MSSDGFVCLSYKNPKLDASKRAQGDSGNSSPRRTLRVNRIRRPILNGRAVALPKPEYPDAARERNLAGMVVVKVEVDESGNVIKRKRHVPGTAIISAKPRLRRH